MRERFDISAYLVIGPENTRGRPVKQIVMDVIDAGFTCVQIRSKIASARDLIDLTVQTSEVISDAGRSDEVTLLVDDRLDVVLAAKHIGAKVDGIHVGQADIPVEVCRRYLGDDAVIGLSARTHDLLGYIREADVRHVDYFGAGPLRETTTKPDCGLDAGGRVVTRDFGELAELSQLSPIPVVVGGGVKLADLSPLARTGVEGFFVVSAVTEADDPRAEAFKLVEAWRANRSEG